jgi:hypothetical protein
MEPPSSTNFSGTGSDRTPDLDLELPVPSRPLPANPAMSIEAWVKLCELEDALRRDGSVSVSPSVPTSLNDAPAADGSETARCYAPFELKD